MLDFGPSYKSKGLKRDELTCEGCKKEIEWFEGRVISHLWVRNKPNLITYWHADASCVRKGCPHEKQIMRMKWRQKEMKTVVRGLKIFNAPDISSDEEEDIVLSSIKFKRKPK